MTNTSLKRTFEQLERWSPGDHVIFRHIWPAGVWAAIPVTVVEDNSQVVSVYVQPGTVFAAPLSSREEHLRVIASGQWTFQMLSWQGHHLWTTAPNEPYSIWTIWTEAGWQHLGWKINPEAPLRRTSIGFDTTYHVIDVIISPDFSRWDWKNEDEFDEAIRHGILSSKDASHIRQETMRIANDVLSGQRAQLRELPAWRPPTDWKIPTLTSNWGTF